MAKLKARGREEIFRVTKVETGGSREGIKGVRHYRALTVEYSFDYLLPVAVIEANSRQEAERNEGHVWWINGAFKGPQVDPRQTGFGF